MTSKIDFMTDKKKEIKLNIDQIPVEGALGLLALGDVGIRLWREAKKKRLAEFKDIKKEKDEQKEGK